LARAPQPSSRADNGPVPAVPELVLAKAAEKIPGPTAMPGGTRGEPKYDG